MGTYRATIPIRESVIAILDEIQDEDLQLEHLIHRIDAAESLRSVEDLAGIALMCVALIAHLTDDAKTLEAALMVDDGHRHVLPGVLADAPFALAELTLRMKQRATAEHMNVRVLG